MSRRLLAAVLAATVVAGCGGSGGTVTAADPATAGAAAAATVDPVSKHMTAAPDTVAPDVKVTAAASWMLETGYRHLPVIENGELLGIVDVREVLWALVSKD